LVFIGLLVIDVAVIVDELNDIGNDLDRVIRASSSSVPIPAAAVGIAIAVAVVEAVVVAGGTLC
jgi:hypothetical protein